MPAAPSNLAASAFSASQIDLSWTDNSNNETGFEVWQYTASRGTWVKVGTVGSNIKTYSDVGLSSSTAYAYQVRAYNSYGVSSFSNTPSATTQGTLPAAASRNSLMAECPGE